MGKSRFVEQNAAMKLSLNIISTRLLGGRHKEGRSRGTGHDPTSLKHRKGEVQIAVDVVLNIEI